MLYECLQNALTFLGKTSKSINAIIININIQMNHFFPLLSFTSKNKSFSPVLLAKLHFYTGVYYYTHELPEKNLSFKKYSFPTMHIKAFLVFIFEIKKRFSVGLQDTQSSFLFSQE